MPPGWGYAIATARAQATQQAKQRDRVYTEKGTRSHVLRGGSSPNSSDRAYCGTSPWPYLWRGTGTQTEHERAKELQLCANCKRLIEMEAHRS